MSTGSGSSRPTERWEKLYREALFEADTAQMLRRIETAKHAILDRLEDVTCARTKQNVQAGELAALRNAHRSLRVLERSFTESQDKRIA
jgi:hypothetical protein